MTGKKYHHFLATLRYMKIGIDARMYGPKQGGLGRYIQQLISRLEELNTNDDFVIFLRRENWDEFSPSSPYSPPPKGGDIVSLFPRGSTEGVAESLAPTPPTPSPPASFAEALRAGQAKGDNK
jgi:hypothetical protein